MKPPGSPSEPTTRIWRTETGLTVVMDDKAQTITLDRRRRRPIRSR